MVFRFAVGEPNGPQSNSWRLWAQREDVYLLQRSMGNVHKFSFHKTGICRWAQVADRPDGSDRAMLKWRRDLVPDVGSRHGSLLISLAFPTNHLSCLTPGEMDEICWTKPAPREYATMVEIFLTREDQDTINHLFDRHGERKLLLFQNFCRGIHLCVAELNFDCGPVELRIPKNPVKLGQVFGDMMFPNIDHEKTGRPVRMLIKLGEYLPPTVWELGGYQISKLC